MTASPAEVFRRLGTLVALEDDRYLVGRDVLLDRLANCWAAPRSPAWLSGAKRVGKSTVAREVERRARAAGASAVYVDAMDLGPEGLDGVLEAVLRELGRPGPEPPRYRFRAAVEHACAPGRPGLVLVVDEFDAVAVRLEEEDQAYLRKLLHTVEGFGALFVSCLPPNVLVEEVSVVSSRLLGICSMHRVLALEQDAVDALARRVGADLEKFPIPEAAAVLWEYAGGLPAVLASLAQCIAVTCHHDPEPFTSGELGDLVSSEYGKTRHLLRGYWVALHPRTRAFLRDLRTLDDARTVLSEDGYLTRRGQPVKPKFLARWGTEEGEEFAGNTTESMPLPIHVASLVAELNEALHREGHADAIQTGNAVLAMYPLIRGGSETQFKGAIDYLYKCFFEGAKATKGSPKPWRLPQPLGDRYGASPVIGDISDLRNYLHHRNDRDGDGEKANPRHGEAAAIFHRHVGTRHPAGPDWDRIRDSILEELRELLQEMLDALPVLRGTSPTA